MSIAKKFANAFGVTLARKIGEGTFANVYTAHRGGEKLCIKVWKDPADQCAHDAMLIRAVEFSSFMPRCLMAAVGATLMTHCPGRTLEQWSPSAKRSDRLVVLRKLETFVDLMNEKGYVHGDLSGSNVLVAPGHVVHIIDPLPYGIRSNAAGLAELAYRMFTNRWDE